MNNYYTYNISSQQKLELHLPAATNKVTGEMNNSNYYWSKLWPSAIAMAEFITENNILFSGKTVLELGGGLGLPAIVAAHYCKKVIFSDNEQAAVQFFKKHNIADYNNIEAEVIDWEYNTLPGADIVLMSDLNYEPEKFEILHKAVITLLAHKTTVVITTPHRLMAKPFIAGLTPYCVHNRHVIITLNNAVTDVAVLVYK